ncbi:hypothetical protein LY78DRAFT_652674 [Colletotrichum sublineola]|nr:hypothetical protein LY78DRAFT_652674 [Colletotrichum sublineola]
MQAPKLGPGALASQYSSLWSLIVCGRWAHDLQLKGGCDHQMVVSAPGIISTFRMDHVKSRRYLGIKVVKKKKRNPPAMKNKTDRIPVDNIMKCPSQDSSEASASC